MNELFGDQPLGPNRDKTNDFETIVIMAIMKRETLKAVQVLSEGDKFLWLPLSQIKMTRPKQDNTTAWPEDVREISMPLWLAKEKELI